MKKFLATFIMVIVLLTAVACSTNTNNTKNDTNTPSQTSNTTTDTDNSSSENPNKPNEEDTLDYGIKIVPTSYNSQAEHRGKVETFTYQTAGTNKTAYVYLPYGYDENADVQYNILYFMHGGGGNAGQFYNRSYALNDILDHAIENREIEPLIVVTPTFYPPNDRNTSASHAGELVAVFHSEFINDLMPSVESHYKTYAANTDKDSLIASRKHRAFGGFSMGSVTTWYQFINALDYVAYFMPLSGDCWQFGSQGGASHPTETAEYLNDYIKNHRFKDDFYIYAMTGSSDIAYNALGSQLNAMRNTDGFTFGRSEKEGNVSFQVLENATHDYTYYRNYIYTILPYFFNQPKAEQVTVKITAGDTIGYIRMTDNRTAKEFMQLLPLDITLQDLHGREYWFAHSLGYDEKDVVHDYAPGQLTYWCGGWVTAYYDRDDDSVIEAGSVVIGQMDETLVTLFHNLNGSSVKVKIEIQ